MLLTTRLKEEDNQLLISNWFDHILQNPHKTDHDLIVK